MTENEKRLARGWFIVGIGLGGALASALCILVILNSALL